MPGHLQLATPAGQPRAATSAIRVAIVDAHAAVRHSMRRVIDAENGLTVVAEADDLSKAMERLRRLRPDVLVLDLPRPDGSWIETIRWLRARVPDTEIIMVTMEASAALADWTLAAGALGFVLKERADTDLPAAIGCAEQRESFVSSPLDERMKITRGRQTGGWS